MPFIELTIKEQPDEPQPVFVNTNLIRYIRKARGGKDHTMVAFDPDHRIEVQERVGDVIARLHEALTPQHNADQSH
jgi:hypothetical protein